MLGLLIIFSFWIAITLIIIIPLLLTFTVGKYLAEKLKLDGLNYYLIMSLIYLIILCLLIII